MNLDQLNQRFSLILIVDKVFFKPKKQQGRAKVGQHNCKIKFSQKSRIIENFLLLYKCCQNQIYTINQKKRLFAMRRFFFRPFFDLNDAFFPMRRIVMPTYRLRVFQNPVTSKPADIPQKGDPHALFNQFFKQHQLKDETEKEFFKKHFPQTVEEKFDPYKVLEISNDASIDQVKQAYRKLAIKYHPKNNASSDAEAKFAEVAKAYEAIIQVQNAKNLDDFGFKSFFSDFEKQVDSFFNPKQSSQATQQTKAKKQTKEPSKNQNNQKQLGELYSESSSYQSVNGQQTKFAAEKIYKKDGKLLKVLREEKLKEDGNIEITQTIDNGQEVKKKTFTQEKGKKTITSG